MKTSAFVRPLDWNSLKESDCLTAGQSRQVDAFAIETLGVGSLILMENAARSAVEWLLQHAGCRGRTAPAEAPEKDDPPPTFWILCGRGNNGGDGFAMARLLLVTGHPVRVFATHPLADMSPDARANALILQALGIPLEGIASFLGAAATLQPGDWIIDALLGTGQTRPLTGELAAVVTAINDSSAQVLAIDLPTGFPADHGPTTENECCVIAHATITFVSPKQGFLNPLARRFLGETHIASIGLPHDELLAAVRGRE